MSKLQPLWNYNRASVNSNTSIKDEKGLFFRGFDCECCDAAFSIFTMTSVDYCCDPALYFTIQYRPDLNSPYQTKYGRVIDGIPSTYTPPIHNPVNDPTNKYNNFPCFGFNGGEFNQVYLCGGGYDRYSTWIEYISRGETIWSGEYYVTDYSAYSSTLQEGLIKTEATPRLNCTIDGVEEWSFSDGIGTVKYTEVVSGTEFEVRGTWQPNITNFGCGIEASYIVGGYATYNPTKWNYEPHAFSCGSAMDTDKYFYLGNTAEWLVQWMGGTCDSAFILYTDYNTEVEGQPYYTNLEHNGTELMSTVEGVSLILLPVLGEVNGFAGVYRNYCKMQDGDLFAVYAQFGGQTRAWVKGGTEIDTSSEGFTLWRTYNSNIVGYHYPGATPDYFYSVINSYTDAGHIWDSEFNQQTDIEELMELNLAKTENKVWREFWGDDRHKNLVSVNRFRVPGLNPKQPNSWTETEDTLYIYSPDNGLSEWKFNGTSFKQIN
ncbi:hypothetical protein FACS1894214_1010 [Planctomycetales bacterium]|nr:hypothetical protein FACS1894214_1010 [Planctomycetales bacterium]